MIQSLLHIPFASPLRTFACRRLGFSPSIFLLDRCRFIERGIRQSSVALHTYVGTAILAACWLAFFCVSSGVSTFLMSMFLSRLSPLDRAVALRLIFYFFRGYRDAVLTTSSLSSSSAAFLHLIASPENATTCSRAPCRSKTRPKTETAPAPAFLLCPHPQMSQVLPPAVLRCA